MTPRQAQIALGGFLMVAAGVAINALFLQVRPAMSSRAVVERPLPRIQGERMRGPAEGVQSVRAPQRATAPADERTQRTARLNPDAGVLDTLPEPAADDEDSETIRAVQRELRQRGYGALVSDGVMRPVVRAAIMAYEHDQGLPLTAEASETLLKRILLGPAAAAEPAAGKVVSARAAQVIRTVQQSLSMLGYQPGRTDGRLGEDTLRAIREFEMDKGLAVKGRICADVMTRLAEAVAARSSPVR